MRHIGFFAIIAAILVSAMAPAVAEETGKPSILERLLGQWTSDGNAFGGPAKSVMVWEQTLGGAYVRLTYKIDMAREAGETSTFEGVAYYRVGQEGEDILAFWADNTGDLHPIKATRDGDALVAHWGAPGAKQGRTRYEILPKDEVAVTDWIKTAEGWRKFNQNTFARVAAVD